jgi:hypothetical protein
MLVSLNDRENIDWDKIDAIIHLAGKAHDTKNRNKVPLIL